MAKTGKTLVTVATYNEIDNLPQLVDEIWEHAPDVDILVVDDNSPDGTGTWCDERAQSEPRLYCLHRTGKLGLGTAITAGLRYAVDHGYRYVVNMDADFSHHPRYLPALRAGMETDGGPPIDVMIGSRYIPGGGVEGWNWQRHFMSRGINVFSRWCLGLRPKDCSGGFRCYRTSAIGRLDFGAIRSHGYSFQEEVLWRLRRLGARFGETPIVFANRTKGKSKIDLHESWTAMCVILALAWENLWNRPARPKVDRVLS